MSIGRAVEVESGQSFEALIESILTKIARDKLLNEIKEAKTAIYGGDRCR